MKKEWQIIVLIISAVLISICFGVYDYLNFEENTVEFSPSRSKIIEVNEDIHSIEKYENSAPDLYLPKNITIIKTNKTSDDIEIRKNKINQPKNILKFASKYNDFENETEILKTNYETTFHEFDFENKTITMKNPTEDRKWQIIVFHWTSIKNLDNGIIEFNIKNDKGVYKVWRSSANNIGYEFYNKTKLVFYDVSSVNYKNDVQIKKTNTIVKFRSTSNDFENETEILKTNNETTFHEFDFDEKTITMSNPTNDNKWQILVFKWNSITKLENGIIEFNIMNDKGVYQIWRSSANIIRYEFYNKTKLVFYDVSRVN